MKILQVYKDYYPVIGGIENHVRLLSTLLSRQEGMEITVLTTSPTLRGHVLPDHRVRVIKAGRLATVASTPISLSLFTKMRALEADIVHLHFPYPVGELAYLGSGHKGPLVITYHSDVVRQQKLLFLYKPFLWRVLQRADAIIASSPNYIRSSPFLSRFEPKCHVIPFGIDLSRFQHRDEERVERIRQLYDPPLLLFVGRFRYYKGLSYLIEAMKEIRATLLLAGSGPLEKELRQQVRTNRLEERVLFLGAVSDENLATLYQACDLFVLPSCERAEAFGITQLEAMACGVPVVSTELGTGTSFVNVDGETGLVVPPASPAALAQAINSLLTDAALRKTMGQRGRERVEAEFGAELMVERVAELYRGLMAT